MIAELLRDSVSHTFVRRLDQARQFCLRVVRRDATTAMPEQILTILERHARRAESTAEGVFEIVDANTLPT